MAREYGIDLRQVKGTGAGGRITKQDLEAYMSAQGARTMAQVARCSRRDHGSAAPRVAAVTPIYSSSRLRRRAAAASAARAIEPMSTMRTKIAEHMS